MEIKIDTKAYRLFKRMGSILNLMYKLYQEGVLRKVTNRATRQQEIYVYKTDTKIGKKYEESPYFIGTQLWDKLHKEIHFSVNVH